MVSPPANNQYVIDATPTMPVVEATAQVVNAIPDPTGTTQFTWTASLKVRKGTGQTVDYSSSLKQSVMTTGTAKYTLATTNPATLVGGTLTLTITATVNGHNLKASTPAGPAIVGTNPQRSDIQTQVDTTVLTIALDGLNSNDVIDDTKRIACQESQQKEFNAAADGGVGPVLISPDNGVGTFQLTYPSPWGP